MIKRTVEISRAAHLSLSRSQLNIRAKDGTDDELSVPIEDLGVLVLDEAGITVTTAVLSAMCQANVAVVTCDERHLPCGMFLPFEGHTLFQKHLRQQMDAGPVVRKQAWQQIIRAKILAQSVVLKGAGVKSPSLEPVASMVKSGDTDNTEARAAQLYFPALFGSGFVRNTGAEGVNAALNYGYAILRAAVARAIAGSGLHPALGIWHRNQYNAFTLADDLMEPLRPSADRSVFLRWIEQGRPEPFDLERAWRTHLLGLLQEDYRIGALKFPLLPALTHYASSVRQFLAGESETLEIPVLIP